MPRNELIGAEVSVLGTAKVTINSATTTNFDFGTPNDLKLTNQAGYGHGDRILIVFAGTTAGTTNTITFVVQDADDSSGSIGTPATAVTDGGTLAAGTGDGFVTVGMRPQNGRPWLRCAVTSNGATDTFVTTCTVIAVPSAI